jgi:AAA family ATP:ADP antiporter
MHKSFISRALRIEPYEVVPALLSALYYFFVLCSYYLIRPLRDERGMAAGADDLPWVMWVTLGAMLLVTPIFGWLARGRSRRFFIPATYRFFALTFLIYALVDRVVSESAGIGLGIAFFVWVSVFNLFANSLMWAFMADGFKFEQSKRLFGFVAIGGSIGATLGSVMALWLASSMGTIGLVVGSILLLEGACQTVRLLAPRFETMRARRAAEQSSADGATDASSQEAPPIADRQSVWQGLLATMRSPYLLAIAGYLFCYALTSTLFYFQQARVVEAAFETKVARREYFATVDLWVNILTLASQVFLTGRVMATFGVAATLAFLPVLTLIGFFVIGADPTLTPFVIFYVLRRAGNFAFSRPARETLFTVVPRDAKYQAKTFIDTFVYRAADAVATPFDFLMQSLQLGVAGLAFAAAPIAVVWFGLALFLGLRQRTLSREGAALPVAPAAP